MATAFGRESFDLTLLLGNSLCLLRQREDRELVAANLRAICPAGGAVVVDERNFRYLLSARAEILRGRFRYKRTVMYCGERIRGVPIAISDDNITFAYMESSTGTEMGRLDMYPFKTEELRSLFATSGFSRCDVYSDLAPGAQDDADFFTYVFRP
jgi:hypothetical protein